MAPTWTVPGLFIIHNGAVRFRASGSGEDVEGLKSQIGEVSCRLIEAQSHKLLLEGKLQEKDKLIKSLQDSLANTLADMKHIRGETQKSLGKHEKRTREGWHQHLTFSTTMDPGYNQRQGNDFWCFL